MCSAGCSLPASLFWSLLFFVLLQGKLGQCDDALCQDSLSMLPDSITQDATGGWVDV